MIQWNGRAVLGVLFDMDGVIADTREGHKESWRQFAAREGQSFDMDDFMLKTFGRGNDEVLQMFYPDHPFDREFFRRKGAEKEEIFLEIFRRGAVPEVPGLRKFVSTLQNREIALAVGSSAPRGNIDAVLETFAIRGAFRSIVSMEDVKRAKPEPDIFLKCCEQLHLAPADCVVLEDSIHGLEAARAAGCRAIGITTMHTAGEITHLCDAAVPDFIALSELWSV
ncbi:HAD family hydrolase [soil metagenome]